jgi:hypothetical protein
MMIIEIEKNNGDSIVLKYRDIKEVVLWCESCGTLAVINGPEVQPSLCVGPSKSISVKPVEEK